MPASLAAYRKDLEKSPDFLRLLKCSGNKTLSFPSSALIAASSMAETMVAGNGVGLAAPQVGVLKRCCVIDVGEGLIELVNPEITAQEGEVTVIEGCLSVPDRAGRVVRPEKVTVHAQDRHGAPFDLTGEGMLAVCLCHEIDHLDGVLYVDKMIEDVSDRYRKAERGAQDGGQVQ